MNRKQQIAIAIPPILTVTMLGVFHLTERLLGPELGWYAGFWVYWPVWCLLFPWWMLGWPGLRRLFNHSSLDRWGWLLFLLPPAIALFGRFFIDGRDAIGWEWVALIAMSFTNGSLEEVLWRGVYVELFPKNRLWGLAWPTVWFALWHLAPGLVSEMNPWLLAIGALVFGTCMGLLAFRTGSIRYSVVSHTLAALANVL